MGTMDTVAPVWLRVRPGASESVCLGRSVDMVLLL